MKMPIITRKIYVEDEGKVDNLDELNKTIVEMQKAFDSFWDSCTDFLDQDQIDSIERVCKRELEILGE